MNFASTKHFGAHLYVHQNEATMVPVVPAATNLVPLVQRYTVALVLWCRVSAWQRLLAGVAARKFRKTRENSSCGAAVVQCEQLHFSSLRTCRVWV